MAAPVRLTRAERAARAEAVADLHAGLAHRRALGKVGISFADIRSEAMAGRWALTGRHTVQVRREVGPQGAWWTAVWESGSGAVLDGAAALCASGLTGFTPVSIDVSLPANNRRWRRSGVSIHRRRVMPPLAPSGVPRVRLEQAAVHAAGWARTDREAALILCLVIQQRLVRGDRLRDAWRSDPGRSVRRSRRLVLSCVIDDLVDGAQSLGELDFSGLCREWGVPPPTRQVVRTLPSGRVYLDAAWEDIGLVVEVDGIGHLHGLSPVDDALRQNELALGNERVLRIPVLGLRLQREAFGEQVLRAHRSRSSGTAA